MTMNDHKEHTDPLPGALSHQDAQLLVEALHALRARKVEALSVVRASGLQPNGQQFEPKDFGIPQIDALLRRLDAAA